MSEYKTGNKVYWIARQSSMESFRTLAYPAKVKGQTEDGRYLIKTRFDRVLYVVAADRLIPRG